MKRALIWITIAIGLNVWAVTPEQAATDAALAAERAVVVQPSGAAWTDVQAELQASESRMHQYVTTEYAVLTANLQALWTSTPPIDPVDPPPVINPPTGSIELGGSYHLPNRITPALNGHRAIVNTPFWQEVNRSVLADTVDPNSAHLLTLLAGANIHNDFFGCRTLSPRDCPGDGSNGGPIWGIPIHIVGSNQPRVNVAVTGYPNESDYVPVPMPANPSIEGWPSLVPPSDYGNSDDHHLIMAVRDDAVGDIQELFELSKPILVNGQWSAAQVSYWDLKGVSTPAPNLASNGLPRREGWTSTDAAGMPRFPMMATYDEASTCQINHALAMTLNVGAQRNAYMFPARHGTNAGRIDDGFPYGARLRLKDSWYQANKGNFTGAARCYVDAMRSYGVMNIDIGGMAFLTGISDDRYDDANLMTLQNINMAQAFEVLKIVPQFELTGPATVAVGVPTTYTFKFSPSVELNGQHGYYLHAYRKNADGVTWARIADNGASGVQPHQVTYTTPTINAPDATFVAPSAGDYLIEVDQAGESKLEWTPPYQIQTTTDGTRGPYPYLPVTAN